MLKLFWASILGLIGLFVSSPLAIGQSRPYIGYVYPAGGQQGTTFAAKLGGQGLDSSCEVIVSGTGVSAKVVRYYRRISPIEFQLLNEQLKTLKRTSAGSETMMMTEPTMMSDSATTSTSSKPLPDGTAKEIITNLENRISEYCNRPASVALASLAFMEITIAPDAETGQRELRIKTPSGISNPMVFHVGQLPEVSRKPMLTSPIQVLGKEQLALRTRPADEAEQKVTLPCVVNGQIASGEVNWYRFSGRKGQRLVISTQARQLIPYIADAVPGWFQPVLLLRDSDGKEISYSDDYRFKPDPTILCELPHDGEYVFGIHDSLYRGREDFVYRISAGELPFLTSLFPLGAQLGTHPTVKAKGWNLGFDEMHPTTPDTPQVALLTASSTGGFSMPFAWDTLPDCLEREPNNTQAHAQKVRLPLIVNGRMDTPNDWDVFRFTGSSGQTIVAEIVARRLDSPMDSVLKLTDEHGNLLAMNDDFDDLGSGVNTHHADSCIVAKLPTDGVYNIHVGDNASKSGDEFVYRLRITPAQPDFALRVAPSSIGLRSKSSQAVSVHVMRKDGFSGPIKVSLKDPPAGFSSSTVTLTGTQQVARLTIKTTLSSTPEPVNLTVMGTAKIQSREVFHNAIPTEDRMQAFFWRHLVPAQEFKALVSDPTAKPEPKRTLPECVSSKRNEHANSHTATNTTEKPKFSKQQIAGRLRDLKLLFDEGLLTEDFYCKKVAECETAR